MYCLILVGAAGVMKQLEAILKMLALAAVTTAGLSVGYYYVVLLPQRDARLEQQRINEQVRIEAQTQANHERIEQEKRMEEIRKRNTEIQRREERAAAQRRYDVCILRAEKSYQSEWVSECRRISQTSQKSYDKCIKEGTSKEVCKLVRGQPTDNINCSLPRTIANELEATMEKAKDRCLQENRAGLN
jgi:hypothetical protein